MATFGLTSAERDVTAPGGITTSLRADGSVKSHVTYLDFTVDGERLFSRLNDLTADGLDFVGVIQDSWPVEAVASIERLLDEAPGDLPDGRTSLYICPECGDLGCGAVTASLEFGTDYVTWHDLAWQADYDDEVSALGEESASVSVTFARKDYEDVLRAQLVERRPLAVDFEYPYERDRRLRRERRDGLLRRLFSRR